MKDYLGALELSFVPDVFDVASVLSTKFCQADGAIYGACPVLRCCHLSQLGRLSLLASSMRVPA